MIYKKNQKLKKVKLKKEMVLKNYTQKDNYNN